MSAKMYGNHRSLVPAGVASGSGPPPPPNAPASNGNPLQAPGGQAPGPGGAGAGPSATSASVARLADLLDFVRHEFDLIGGEATALKSQRDDLEHQFFVIIIEQIILQIKIHTTVTCSLIPMNFLK